MACFRKPFRRSLNESLRFYNPQFVFESNVLSSDVTTDDAGAIFISAIISAFIVAIGFYTAFITSLISTFRLSDAVFASFV